MEFSTDVFEKPFVQTMWRSYLALLEGAAANPDETVARLPVVTAAERQRIMVDWNQTGKPYDDQRCVHELFEAQVERTPEAPALVCGLETLSYRALNRRANQLAWRLKRLGIGPETMVGLFMERSSEMVLGIYGIIKAGGAYVPIDPEFPAERLQFLLQDTRVPVVLTQQHLRSALPDHPGTTICLDVEGSSLKAESAENLDSGVRTDNLCYVIYTSGSTGKPKGVMNEHRGIVNRLVWMQDEYCLTGTDRVLQKTPFSFDVSVWEFFWPLLVGATLVVAPPGSHKDPSELIEQIVSQNISTIHFVPSMLGVFLKDRRVEACSCLKRVFCSGEALPYEFQEEFFARLPSTELHNLYGPTEAAVDVSYWPCRPRSDKRIVPIGKPVANTQLYVLDSLLQPVPAGVAGELHIGGVQVARGYWNRPELTRDKFIPDPFSGRDGARLYKTGDLVRHLEDGNIEYLGRNDFQVKIRGQRIELGEIEAALMTHPQVAEALVTAEDAGSGDKRLIAYTVAKAGAELSVKDLRDHLKAILPESLIPGTVMQLESFPLLANGKINRRALPVAKRERVEAGAEYSAPQNDLESGVAAIWQEVLGIEEVGVNDNFFDIGGHSLLLVSVLRLLHERYDGGLRIMNLFEYPTIRSLAEYLGKKRLTASRVTRAAERAGRKKARLSGPQPRLRDMEP
jgi:amino acid adenylation domain-containing protein